MTKVETIRTILLNAVVFAVCSAAAPPALPEGLDNDSTARQPAGGGKGTGSGADDGSHEPLLPRGLGGRSQAKDNGGNPDAEPALPSGLGTDIEQDGSQSDRETKHPAPIRLPSQISGFAELRTGVRTREAPNQDDFTLAETRLQLSLEKYLSEYIPRGLFRGKVDFLYDDLAEDRRDLDLEEGTGFLDLRELYLSFTPLPFADVKIGRQILTWGTGDLVFINDLFPKGWRSFLLGRDPEYLKAPSDAAKVSLYSPWANLDIVYVPRFDADRFVNGERISVYDPRRRQVVGNDTLLHREQPDNWFRDDEVHLRLHRQAGSYGLAAYGYHGFWKTPMGLAQKGGKWIFMHPDLSVVGASVRGPLLGGIGNAEIGHYFSHDDPDGDDPTVPNSETRLLLGYEMEAARKLTVGLQYKLEQMRDFDSYESNLPQGSPGKDRNRHLFTLRVTKLLLRENLELSLFVFYSPSDGDVFARPLISYKITDRWQASLGANWFDGNAYSTYGQYENNSSVYAALRFSF